MTGSFLREPPVSPRVQELYDEDLAGGGYIWSLSRLWAHQPDTLKRLFELMSQAFTPSGLTFRQRGILVTAAASALGDSYCSLARGGKLGKASDAATAAGVLDGSDAGLTDQEKAMAAWARKVATDPNATTPADIQALRDSGLDDGQILLPDAQDKRGGVTVDERRVCAFRAFRRVACSGCRRVAHGGGARGAGIAWMSLACAAGPGEGMGMPGTEPGG